VAKAFSPLDEQLRLARSGFSPAFVRQMGWLGGLLPFEQSVEVMARIGERFISQSTTWRMVKHYGEQLQTVVEHERQQVRVERIQLPDARHDHEQRKGVSMDGGMVNIRGEGWREMKVGTVFDVELRLERNPQTRELDEMAHGVKVHYTAILGTKDEFTPALWALAVERDLPTARKRSVVADGALWIWDEKMCVPTDNKWWIGLTRLSIFTKQQLRFIPTNPTCLNANAGSKRTNSICTWDTVR
jgi:hypothetical protein